MSFSLQFLGKIWIDTSRPAIAEHYAVLFRLLSIWKKILSYSTDPKMAFWLTLERELGRHNDYALHRWRKVDCYILIHDSFHD